MTELTGLDWEKNAGLVPAIIQDAAGGAVLMLGYMNREALAATLQTRRVTFWSRSRGKLWIKGETSGHFLTVRSIAADCDGDTLLVMAESHGPVCHLGTMTCWGETAPRAQSEDLAFLAALERIIAERLAGRPAGSYTAGLAAAGVSRIAQKVGEEALELALAAVAEPDQKIIAEAADLLYHSMLLLQFKGLALAAVVAELRARHSAAASGSGAA